MSGISSVGNYAYVPQAQTSFGSNREYNGIEDFKPGLIMDPMQQEKAKKTKRNVLIVAGLGIAAAATWFFTRGKGKGLITKIKDLLKGTDDVVKNTKYSDRVSTKADDAIKKGTELVNKNDKTAKIIQNIDTKHTNAKTRKLVEDVVDDVPTKTQQLEDDRSIAYQAPTAEQKMAIAKNNSQARKATAEARQIGNNTSQESVQALNQAKQSLTEVNTKLNGVYNNGKVEFTLKDGKIVEIKAPDGRVIKDELKIAKFEHKHGVKVNELAEGNVKPVSTDATTQSVGAEVKTKSQAPTKAPKADNAARIAELEAKIAKQNELMAKYQKPGMQKYAKPLQASIDNLTAQLEALKSAA